MGKNSRMWIEKHRRQLEEKYEEVVKMSGRTSIISLLTIILFLLCPTNLVYSQANLQGKGGKGEHEGWTKGERVGQKSEKPADWEKGWEKLTPPGWDNWSKKGKKKWEKDLARAKKKIKARAEKKGWGAKDKEKATIALEFAARRGVPVGHAKKSYSGMYRSWSKRRRDLGSCCNFI